MKAGTDMSKTDVGLSNSLTELAARINAAHEAAESALKSSVVHAMQAGELLVEAKEKIDHGEWLPWLKANFPFSDRTARLYMQIARRRPEVEAKMATVADLTLRDVFAEPEPVPGTLEWVEKQFNEPFNDSDFEDWPSKYLRSKIIHQIGLPISVAGWLDVGDSFGLKCLCMCPADDLREALVLLAQYAKAERRLPIGVVKHSALEAWIDLLIPTQALFVAVWDAIVGKKPTQLERERERVSEAIGENIEAAQAALRSGELVGCEGRKGKTWDDIRALVAIRADGDLTADKRETIP
jgi:hypothetical protein